MSGAIIPAKTQTDIDQACQAWFCHKKYELTFLTVDE
jgi:hypothetical protein